MNNNNKWIFHKYFICIAYTMHRIAVGWNSSCSLAMFGYVYLTWQMEMRRWHKNEQCLQSSRLLVAKYLWTARGKTGKFYLKCRFYWILSACNVNTSKLVMAKFEQHWFFGFWAVPPMLSNVILAGLLSNGLNKHKGSIWDMRVPWRQPFYCCGAKYIFKLPHWHSN